jgi:hypothetical protein
MMKVPARAAASRVLLAVSLAVLVIALGTSLFACGSTGADPAGTGQGTTQGAAATAAADSKIAPAFSGSTLAGDTVSLDQYRGKPLLLVYMTST